jgi:hypothetical protein
VEHAAFEIGLVIAIERNRRHMNQQDLADAVGGNATFNDISRIERGSGVGFTKAQVDRLFAVLRMDGFDTQREFLKWWQ